MSSGKLFLINWHQQEAQAMATGLRAAGWQVEVEHEDGARASKAITANPPAAVVISLARLPSHGRETAHYLRTRKALAGLPIIFVGGEPKKVAAVRTRVPKALYTTSEQLPEVLDPLAPPPE